MKKVHISYANESYYKSLELLEKTTLEIGGVDLFFKYTEEKLKTSEFWKKNQYILSSPRGAGYWLWKPYIILDAFEMLSEGDIILYSDAGLKVIDNLDPLYLLSSDSSDDYPILFKVPGMHKAKMWTKKDTFILMDADSEKFWNADMSNGAISLWKKTEKNIALLKEWLRYLKDARIITDDDNLCGKPNFLEFKGHRHDQSALSILRVKYNIPLYRDPTQWGNTEIEMFTNCTYPQLFHHHRNFKH